MPSFVYNRATKKFVWITVPSDPNSPKPILWALANNTNCCCCPCCKLEFGAQTYTCVDGEKKGNCTGAGGVPKCNHATCQPDTCCNGACCQGTSCSIKADVVCQSLGGTFKGCGTTCEDGCGCPPGQVPCGSGCCPEGQTCVDGQCVTCEGTCCINGAPQEGYTQETCEECSTTFTCYESTFSEDPEALCPDGWERFASEWGVTCSRTTSPASCEGCAGSCYSYTAGACGTWVNSCAPCACTPPTPYDDCPYEPGTCNRAFCVAIANSYCFFETDPETGQHKWPPVLNCSLNTAEGVMQLAPAQCESLLSNPGSCLNGALPDPGGEIQYGEPFYQPFGRFWAVECWRCHREEENPLP